LGITYFYGQGYLPVVDLSDELFQFAQKLLLGWAFSVYLNIRIASSAHDILMQRSYDFYKAVIQIAGKKKWINL